MNKILKKYVMLGLFLTSTSFNLHAKFDWLNKIKLINDKINETIDAYPITRDTIYLTYISTLFSVLTHDFSPTDNEIAPALAVNTLVSGLIATTIVKKDLESPEAFYAALGLTIATGILTGTFFKNKQAVYQTNYTPSPVVSLNQQPIPTYWVIIPLHKLSNKPVMKIVGDTPDNYLLAIDQFYASNPKPRAQAYNALLEIKQKVLNIQAQLITSSNTSSYFNISSDMDYAKNLLENVELRLKCLEDNDPELASIDSNSSQP